MTALTYATGKPLPPENEWVPRLFFRGDVFYPLNLPEDCDLNDHVVLNPGITRIEDISGNVLWPEGTKQ